MKTRDVDHTGALEDHNRRILGFDVISWPDWPQWRRADLEEAFVDATDDRVLARDL